MRFEVHRIWKESMMIVGVGVLRRVVVVGNILPTHDGFTGNLLSGKFFARSSPKWLGRAGSYLYSIRFFARGSYNDYSSEPTTNKVSARLALLSGVDCMPAVKLLGCSNPHGCATHKLVRYYYECSDTAFWQSERVSAETMRFVLRAEENTVKLLAPHNDHFLGDVARQLAGVLRTPQHGYDRKAA